MKSLLIFPRKGIMNMIIYEKFLEIFCVKIKYIKIDFSKTSKQEVPKI